MDGKVAVLQSNLRGSFPRGRAFFLFSKSQKNKKSGQAMVEYVLLLCIAASLAIGFNTFFRQAVGFGILRFNAVLESELRSGEFENPSTVGMWEN